MAFSFSSFFGSGGVGTRRVLLEIAGDDSNLDAALKRAKRNVSSFGKETAALQGSRGLLSQIGGKSGFLFGSTAFIGGAAAGAVFKTLTSAASDLNEQVSKTNYVFGTASKSVENWATTTARSAGISENATLAAASNYGLLFKNIGQTDQQAAAFSKRLVQLAGDLSSFSNTSVQDSLDAIRSGLVGQVEPLRRYGVFLSQARAQQEALRETGKKSVKDLTTQDIVLARYNIILKDTGKAQGDFARTATGLANQQRTFQAQLSNTAATLGKALLPVEKQALQDANDLLGGIDGLITGLGKLAQVKVPPIQINVGFNVGFPGGKLGDLLKGALGIATKIGPLGEGIAVAQGIKSFTNPFDPFKGKLGTDTTGQRKGGRGGLPAGPSSTTTTTAGTTTRTGPTLSREQKLLLARDQATINNYLSDDLKTAGALVSFYKQQVAKAKDRKTLYAAEKNLSSAQADLFSVQKQIADNATRDAQKAGQALKDKAKAAAEAQKKLIEKLGQQATDFKNKVLAALDNRSTNLTTQHDLQEAQTKLKLALRLGGPATIKEARYEVAQARIARQRALIEQSSVTASKAGTFTFTGPITINGVTNVKQFLAELNKLGLRTTTQSRGRGASLRPGHV